MQCFSYAQPNFNVLLCTFLNLTFFLKHKTLVPIWCVLDLRAAKLNSGTNRGKGCCLPRGKATYTQQAAWLMFCPFLWQKWEAWKRCFRGRQLGTCLLIERTTNVGLARLLSAHAASPWDSESSTAAESLGPLPYISVLICIFKNTDQKPSENENKTFFWSQYPWNTPVFQVQISDY